MKKIGVAFLVASAVIASPLLALGQDDEEGADDTAAECIAEPGTVGFAGDEFARYIYDDFRRTML